MVKLKTWNAFAVGQESRDSQLPELTTVDKGLLDVLLDIEIVVVDRSRQANPPSSSGCIFVVVQSEFCSLWDDIRLACCVLVRANIPDN